jgi:hypothetical protein
MFADAAEGIALVKNRLPGAGSEICPRSASALFFEQHAPIAICMWERVVSI